MRIYTRKGDAGDTSLLSGARVRKSNTILQAIGAMDELNAVLGLASSFTVAQDIQDRLQRVQAELLSLGADLAAVADRTASVNDRVSTSMIARLETEIDAWAKALPPLNRFILPGGSPGSAHLHHARTVCRRAERWIVALSDETAINPDILRYINRLSDWLFVAARIENRAAGISDLLWSGERDAEADGR